MTGFPPRLLPVGEGALAVELGDSISALTAARVRGLDLALVARAFPWLRETVPTYRSLLVLFDPAAGDEASARLLELAAAATPLEAEGRQHEVPAVYGGADGPDLAEVARHCGMTEADVVDRHTREDYVVFMLGFMPGFAYMGPLPRELETPRQATPRVRVPAGAVAIAGRQTGVYPSASPGGWNLIARTSLALFDPGSERPALFAPGDRVRFRAVETLPAPPAAREAPVVEEAAVEVVAPGLFTSVQDRGRRGFRYAGVASAGAWDRHALDAANAALGNDPGAAALECTLQGPTLRFLRSVRFAVCGADLGAALERADIGGWPVPPGEPVLARAGNVLRLGERRRGCRAYLAFAGGIAVPEALGSRSTDMAGGFGGLGGRALRAGDRLPLGDARLLSRAPRRVAVPSGEGPLRVVLGPQEDAFAAEEVRGFLDSAYEVRPDSDRVGCRLRGRRLVHRGAGEITTDGMLPGCIQVPPDGAPIVMGPDGPTTGGYPKIAVVIGADLWRLGQLVPGDTVRFRAVSAEEAARALEEA